MTRKDDGMNDSAPRPLDDRPPPLARPRRRPFAAAIATLAVVAAIAYAALLAISRTAGFRSFLAGQLEKRTGLACAVGGSGLSPALNLSLRDVEARDRENPAAGVRVRSVRFSGSPLSVLFALDRVRAVRVDGAHAVLARGADGRWKPEAAASFAQSLDVLSGQGLLPAMPGREPSAPRRDDPPAGADEAAPAAFRPDLLVDARRVNVEWRGAGDAPEVAVEDASVQITPLSVPARRMTHVAVSIGRLARDRGETMSNIRTEFLLLGPRRILLGLDVGREGGADSPLPALESLVAPAADAAGEPPEGPEAGPTAP
jgi:hypothetical protein